MKRDPYLYPGTDVLINKGNCRSQEELDSMEADYVSARIKALMLNPLPGTTTFHTFAKYIVGFFRMYLNGREKPDL